jgi:predicted hydrocarbon binding protein
MTQTQVQIQTPRKTYTRSEFFEAMHSMIRVHDYRAAVIYLNSVVREVIEANGSSYSVILNPYEPIENVVGIWLFEEEKTLDGKTVSVITVHILYLTRIAVIYKLVCNPETDEITTAYAYYQKL